MSEILRQGRGQYLNSDQTTLKVLHSILDPHFKERLCLANGIYTKKSDVRGQGAENDAV